MTVSLVMAGLVPAIHAFPDGSAGEAWMPGIKPGMTNLGNAAQSKEIAISLSLVMRGLDPRIHDEAPHSPEVRMDCRVKPGNDEKNQNGLQQEKVTQNLKLINLNRRFAKHGQAVEVIAIFSLLAAPKSAANNLNLNRNMKP